MLSFFRKITNLQLLMLSFAVGNASDGMSIALFPLFASLVIKDPILIASVLALRTLPWLILSIPAGILLDRYDRKNIMTIANTLRGLSILIVGILLYTSTELASVLIFPVAFLVGTCEVFYDTGVFASVPEIVPREHLLSMQGFLASTEMVAKAGLGAAVGAMVFSYSPILAISVNSLLYLISGRLIHLLPLQHRQPKKHSRVWDDLVRGFSIIWQSKVLTGLSLVAAIHNIAFFATTSTLVIYLKDILKESDLMFSLVNSSIAIGLFTGGIFVSKLAQQVGRKSSYVANLCLFSTALFLIAFFPNAQLMFFGFLIVGIAWGIGNSISAAYRQSKVENRDLGKVGAFSRLLTAGVQPLASVTGGWMVMHISYQHTYLSLAFFSLISPAVFFIFIRDESLD